MATLSYTMTMSIDGYVEDPTGSIGFGNPSDEVHRFANQQARETTAFLFGRALYGIMEDFWTDPQRADAGGVEAEFAREYIATPRIIFSDTLDSVAPGCRLVRRADAVDEVARLKRESDGDLAVAGPGLAASLLDLIDDFRPRVAPVFLGGGKPYFPPGHDLTLRLTDQRIFDDGTVALHYRRVG